MKNVTRIEHEQNVMQHVLDVAKKEDIRRHGNKKCQTKTVESKMMNAGETRVLTKPPKLEVKLKNITDITRVIPR